MPSRNDILSKAIDDCLKEIYSIAQPEISWNDFILQCKEYSEKYLKWEEYRKNKIQKPEWEGKNITECIGPRPYEFYYVPKNIQKEIADSYIYAYKIDEQQELLNTIQILKNYCKEPIIDKYIDDWTDEETGFHHPGYRSYEHPDNLKKEIEKILGDIAIDNDYYQDTICDKFFEFLDMAGNFFNWNRDLNTFNISVYLGPSPNSNKKAVIENWKKYRNQDIKIDEEQIKKEYYGEELD